MAIDSINFISKGITDIRTYFLFFARSKDDKPVAKDFYKLHQLGDKFSLSISDVLPEDTGFYTCTASNPAGRAERTIKLKVRGRELRIDSRFGFWCWVDLVFVGNWLFLTICFHSSYFMWDIDIQVINQ